MVTTVRSRAKRSARESEESNTLIGPLSILLDFPLFFDWIVDDVNVVDVVTCNHLLSHCFALRNSGVNSLAFLDRNTSALLSGYVFAKLLGNWVACFDLDEIALFPGYIFALLVGLLFISEFAHRLTFCTG